jgi:hypothetical protein
MSWMSWAVPLATGLLGANASKKGTETTQQEKMDPRMDRFVYGPDGQSGLLGSAFGLAQQQMATGGLNDMQRGGMEMQRQFLTSPQYHQGYNNMMGVGQSLMGSGVAGNPFTGGERTSFAGFQQPTPFAYTTQGVPTGMVNAVTQPMQQQDFSNLSPKLTQPATAQAPAPNQHGLGRSGNGQVNFGGGGGGDPGGQGISNEGIQAALNAMALSENPAIRALFPTIAALLGVGGRMGADAQINGLSAAGDKLGNVGSFTNPGPGGLLGMGTISDADGNVRSISTDAGEEAAMKSIFGTTSGRTNRDGSAVGSANGFGGVSGNSYGGSFRGGGISNR